MVRKWCFRLTLSYLEFYIDVFSKETDVVIFFLSCVNVNLNMSKKFKIKMPKFFNPYFFPTLTVSYTRKP